MIAILLLGRNGDILNILPVAKDLFDKGEKPVFVVSRVYWPTLMGCSYLTPDPVHFSIHKLEHALEYAEAKYGKENVLNATAWGKKWHGRRDGSFNLLSWENVGYGNDFEDTKNFPLVFDKRDAERESFLLEQHVKDTRPLILTCLGCCKSSPFHHASTLNTILARKWGQSCKIVDLCAVKAARIYDLLGLFERASILVTGDTAALHLATATPQLSVVALLNDNQFLASKPRCNVAYATNYAQAMLNVTKIHEAIFAALQERRRRQS